MDDYFKNTQSGQFDLDSDIECPWQQLLPDNLIFEIFSFLDANDLISASETCKSWWRVAQDDFLWKDLLCKKCSISDRVLPKDKECWKSEYKRIFYNSCFVASETLDNHIDEVYHVSFSASGKLFSTVGRDGTAKIWKTDNPTTLYGSLNLKLKSSSDYTRFSEFNKSETLIMVACLVGNGFWSREGLLVIASVKPKPEVLYAVQTDFGNFRGAWMDDTSFLNATILHTEDYRETFCLKQHEVSLSCKPIDLKQKSYTEVSQKFQGKGRTVLKLNHNASGSHDFVRVIDCEKLRQLVTDLNIKLENWYPCQHNCTENETENKNNENFTTGSSLCSCSKNIKNPLLNEKYEKLILMAQDCDEMNITTVGDIVIYSFPSETQEEENSQSDEEESSDEEAGLVHSEMKHSYCNPVHKICCQGGIIGINLSPDQRYLVYNYRRPENDDEGFVRSYSEDMEIKIFDLVLGCDTGMCYKGHKAEVTHSSLSYIFPSLSTDYVASGSETASAYIWDRHYGYCLGALRHTVGPQDKGVNAVAFNPSDQEVLISTGDDYKVRVWRSKQRMKELSDIKTCDREAATCSKFLKESSSDEEKKTEKKVGKETPAGKGTEEDESDRHVRCCFYKKKSKRNE